MDRRGKPIPAKVYLVAAANTNMTGPRRHGWTIKGKRPGNKGLMKEAGTKLFEKLDPNFSEGRADVVKLVDTAHVGNFIGTNLDDQGHLGGFVATIHPDLEYIPTQRVEAACASGGKALVAGLKDIVFGHDISLVFGTEVPL